MTIAPLCSRGRVKVPTPQYKSITLNGRPVCNLSERAAAARITACINAVSASRLVCRKLPAGGYNVKPPTALSSCKTTLFRPTAAECHCQAGKRLAADRQAFRVADNAVSTSSGSISSGRSRISAPLLSKLTAIWPLCPAGDEGRPPISCATVLALSATRHSSPADK